MLFLQSKSISAKYMEPVFGARGFTCKFSQIGFGLLAYLVISLSSLPAESSLEGSLLEAHDTSSTHGRHKGVVHILRNPNPKSSVATRQTNESVIAPGHVAVPEPDLSMIAANETSESPGTGNITKCNQQDSAGLNKCLQHVLKSLRPRLAEGIPEISLPPLEPLQLENVEFQQGSGAVKVASKFMAVEVSGLSNFTQFDFWVDVPKKTLDFDLIFPQLHLSGLYELSGNIFFLPIGGSGEFYFNLSGARTKGTSQLSLYKNATTTQVEVKKTDINIEIETIKVHLNNLFNGDPLMGEVINRFLNENSQEVFEEIKPQIGKQVGRMMSLLANRALAAISTNGPDDVPFSLETVDEQ